MIFALGMLCGLVLSLIVVILSVYFNSKGRNLIETIQTSAKPNLTGAIIKPKSDIQRSREQIIKHNQDAGLPTPIEQLP